ncbi:hypothetical protein EB75_19760 [Mycobacterium sp. ST-F2]|nr:hypothetical protein EB75_19760 [Mycobacterium sp. ST-F2]
MNPRNDDGFAGDDAITGPIRMTAAPDHDTHYPRQHPDLTPISTHFTTAEPDGPTIQYATRASAEDLGLLPRKQAPQNGFRKVMNRMTGGTVNVAAPQSVSRHRAPGEGQGKPARGAYSIAVLSLKGGVGKTTTTVCMGSMFASSRGDRVVAVDANPDFGTLAQRGPNTTRSTVRDLLSEQQIFRYADVRRHTSQSASRLEILASERDPAVSEAFSESDYRAVHNILDRFYNIILTDCGTGLTHSAMKGVLDTADALVLVASPAVDSARSALATLDWLQHHGYAHLVPHTTLVISSARPGTVPLDIEKMIRHFKARIGSVFVIPFDDHLAEGADISMDLLNRKTKQAFTDLTAALSKRFTRVGRAPRLD